MAHFSEYAVFALLAARAFANSSHEFLRRNFFYITFLLIFLYSLSDEYHQSFVASRVGTIYDSFIDTAGGLTALIIYTLWRRRKSPAKAQRRKEEDAKNKQHPIHWNLNFLICGARFTSSLSFCWKSRNPVASEGTNS